MLAGEKTPVNITVPLRFNGQEMEKARSERVNLTIDRLHRDYINKDRADVKAPYQRHEAWSGKDQRLFMASAFSGFMPLGNVYLCKKSSRANCKDYWTIDGRQRISALRDFFEDRLAIEVKLSYDDGTTLTRRMKWSEIQGDEDCEALRDQFLNSEIPVVFFEWMPLETQRKMFVAVNSGRAINSEEAIYCNHFWARWLLAQMFDEIFGDLKEVCQNSVRHKRRFAHIKTVHELLVLCGGNDFSQEPAPRQLRAKDREPSAKILHNYLTEQELEWDDKVGTVHLKELHLTAKLPWLKGLASLLHEVFTNDTSLGRTTHEGVVHDYVLARNLTDVMGFLYKAIKEGRTTITQLRNNSGALAKGLAAYYTDKPSSYANQSTSDLPVMQAKYKLMEKHLKRAF